MRATSVRSRRGGYRMFAGVLLNRTADVEVAQEADILRRVVSESPLAHVIAERGQSGCFDVSSINGAAEVMFSTPAAAAVGRPLEDLLSGLIGLESLAPALIDRTEASLQSVEVATEIDGNRIVFETLIQGAGDKGIALTFNDISERVRATVMLREQALHDALTGLPNRRLLAKRLASDLVDGASAGHSVSLITLDLDQFKEVNDALGHEVGDMLLVAMADRLIENAPDGSLVARLGGDEFAVLLPRATLAEARRRAETLAAISRESIVLDGLNLPIRASMGVVSSPVHGTEVSELMRLADVAMYASKRSGRDVTTYDVADNPFSKRRVRLLGELEMGLEAGEFEVFYQPIVDMDTERTVATEGLLRWRHPELGLIPPGEFVELAEVTGTIGMLTRMVIRQVLSDAKILERAGFPVLMSANLSTRNLFEVDFVSAVTEIVDECGLPDKGLRLEITEGDIMEDVGRARQVMRSLSAIGISLAIDDFGTGHSSLERLRDLPVSCVKIDQGFISSLLDGPRSQNLLRDILVMLDNLGFETVAEGVEDRSSYHLLGEFGCTRGQGFLWSRAVPLADLLGYLVAEHDEVRTPKTIPLRSRS